MIARAQLWCALLLGGALLQAASGCGDNERTPAPASKAGIIEPAAGGAAGADPGAARAGAAGSDSHTGGADTNDGARAALGLPCSEADDCADGLSCLSADESSLAQGSPPGGLCTARCTTDPTSCDALGGRCLSFGDDRYCVKPCEFGAGLKCRGRSDFACEASYRRVAVACDLDSDCGSSAVCRSGSCYLVTPVCLPRCNGAHDCPADRACDPLSGECVTSPPTGDPSGAPCDLEGADSCRGICLSSPSEAGGRCVEFCTLGAQPACGEDSACVVSLASTPAASSGDQGACARLCHCDGDCDFGLSCLSLPPSSLNAPGYCGVPSSERPSLDCGAAGGAGAPGARTP